jgi:hypothetical protein
MTNVSSGFNTLGNKLSQTNMLTGEEKQPSLLEE